MIAFTLPALKALDLDREVFAGVNESREEVFMCDQRDMVSGTLNCFHAVFNVYCFALLTDYLIVPQKSLMIHEYIHNFTGVQASGVIIVYCDSAVSYGPKL